MTTDEFALEFDVIYNSIASNAAQPIEPYEKSVFLTQAQEEIVKNYYNPKGNKYQEGFELTEKRRRDLDQLVRTGSSINWADSPQNSLLNISVGGGNFSSQLASRFFAINDDVMFIVGEKAKMISSNECYNNLPITVRPITHNELTANVENPFKSPTDFAWRMDIQKITANFNQIGNQTRKVIELIFNASLFGQVTEYKYRYIKYPSPIILEDLPQGLSVNGIDVRTECELSNHMHREILNRAVELALEVSGNPRTESKLQLNQRSE